MGMAGLWCARPADWLSREAVPFEDHYLREGVREDPCGTESRHTPTDDDRAVTEGRCSVRFVPINGR
jgi:hypothetical protein